MVTTNVEILNRISFRGQQVAQGAQLLVLEGDGPHAGHAGKDAPPAGAKSIGCAGNL
jgi:hypothetical protein